LLLAKENSHAKQLMSAPTEQIKSRLSIVDVVGSYIKLDKAGGSYKALCPFHHEKSPSFNVSPSRDAYYCFGCNRGGDIFTFVQEIEGIEFVEALKILAARAGVELTDRPGSREDKSERDRLYSVMEDVTTLYEKLGVANSEVQDYLKGRGLTEETITSFRIGYAPNEWRVAYDHLHAKGYTDLEIEKAGLIKPTEGKSPYDRFRGRVMFPIFDNNGRVVAFSGRVFGHQQNQDGTDVAKYINSPETPLYDKSSILFGYDRAKMTIRQQNFSILVEGQMDLIMAHQAGTPNAVAVSGTALTEKHLVLLKRLSDNAVFAFDADEAGLKATARAFHLALAAGMNIRVALIPQDDGQAKDPADYIKANPSGWSEVIASSKHIIDFYLGALASRGYPEKRFRDEVRENVLPLVMAIQSKIEQAHYIIEIARKLGVPDTAVWEEVKQLERAGDFVRDVAPRQEMTRETTAPQKSRRQVAEEEIIGILLWQEGHMEPSIDVIVVRQAYRERMDAHELLPHAPSEEEIHTLAMKAEYKHEHGPMLQRSVDELMDTLEEEVLREKQAALWKKLSDAEMRGAKDEAKQFLQEYQSITPRIIALEDRRVKRGAAT
jgi:DNA primase